jgi:hypothetical protein
MSSNNAASNVIPMREFERPPSTQQQAVQFERLLQECQDVAAERLGKSVTGMLDKADEALWNLANSGTERELRDRYLKAKDKVRSERHLLEEQFRDNYLAEFERRMHRDGKSPQQFSQYDFTSTELGLVADDDLEETLKLNDMAAKVRRYCEEELAALDQRVGVLVGDATLQGEGNPFSPQAICSAFKQACRHVEPDLKVRMVFHALFDDHVLDDIRSIYKDLNALLVQRSILPKIRYGTRRGADGATPQSGSAAGELSEGARAAGARGEGGSEQDFFAVLQNLLGVNARTMLGMPGGAGIQVQQPAGGPQAGATQIPGFPPIAAGGVAPGAPVVMLQGAELLGSLTRIQHGDVSMIAGGNLPLSSTLVQPGTTNVLRELKETNLGGGLGQMDAMTLDIVSMLFDEIFDDARVAVAMKGLIGRLQIPMLKVALLDKSFFSNKVHAARRLLDSLGEIGLGLPDDFDHTSALYKQIETVLQKLIDGFREEMQVFDDAREELERLITEQNQHADEEAARVARGIEQQEKLELAKTVAQDEIRRRAEERKIPRVVLKFLAEQWVKLLLVAHAKHGTDSELWKTALATMDMLIWSVTPMPLLEERRVLGTKLPGLLKRLSAGMQMIRVDDDTRKKFFSKLMRCHTNIINGVGPTDSSAAKPAAAAQAASPPPAASAKPPAAPDHTQAASSAETVQAASKQKTQDAPLAQAAASAQAAPTAASTQGAPSADKAQAPSSAQTAQAASKQKTQAAPLAQAAASAQAAPSAQGAPSADKVQAAAPPQTAQAGSKQTTQPAPPAQAAPSAQAASSAQAVPPRQTTLGAPSGPPAQAGPSAQSPATPSVPSVHAPAAASAQAARPAQSTSKPPAQSAAPAQPVAAAPAPPELTEMAEDDSLDFTGLGSEPAAALPPAAERRQASAPDEDTEPAAAPPSFSAVVIENPFGEGEIEVEEISMSELPGVRGGKGAGNATQTGDEYTRLASSLKEGAWVELRNQEHQWQPARLSYISPVKGIYLFVSRQGRKVGEYSLAQLAREFRSGRAAVLDSVPLFDRAMTSLVGVLKGGAAK